MTASSPQRPVVWSDRPLEALRRAVATAPPAASGEMAADAYLASNRLFREFFLLRLRMLVMLINRLHRRGEIDLSSVFDLGGGLGLMCGLLAPYAHALYLLDVDCRMARLVLAELGAANVTIEEGDALQRGGAGQANAIIAADVLEHFHDLGPIVAKLREWLRPGGVLLTSLPTENIWYRLLRLVFGVAKPVDHYHTAAHVEAVLRQAGFEPRARLFHPLGLPLFSLFRITAWRRT